MKNPEETVKFTVIRGRIDGMRTFYDNFWGYLGIAAVLAYVLALLFIVPDTTEARAVATVLFACFAISYAAYSIVIWRDRA